MTRSSGYMRFIGPYVLLFELDLLKNWFYAHGPGTVLEVANSLGASAPFLLKTIFEFGVIPTVAFLVFILRCATLSAAPLPMRVGVLVIYFVITGGLLSVNATYWVFLICALPVRSALETAQRPAERALG